MYRKACVSVLWNELQARTLIPPLYKMAEGALGVQIKLAQPRLCRGCEMEGETQSSWGFLLLSRGSRNNLLRTNHGKRQKKKKKSCKHQ